MGIRMIIVYWKVVKDEEGIKEGQHDKQIDCCVQVGQHSVLLYLS